MVEREKKWWGETILFGTRIARWFMGGELLKTFFAYYLF